MDSFMCTTLTLLRACTVLPADLAEMRDDIKAIKRLLTKGTRRASTITAQDLDNVEASLDICFVPVLEDGPLRPESEDALQDDTELPWEDNEYEAKHIDACMQAMQSKVGAGAAVWWWWWWLVDGSMGCHGGR